MRVNWENRLNLKFENRVLERVNKAKYLGMTLDERLTWKNHSLELQAKLRKVSFLFFHLKKYFNEKHLKKLYLPLYESVLNYGIIHWGKPLKILQNKVCRNVLSLPPRTTETMIYSKMGVLRLEELYKYRLGMFLFKQDRQSRDRPLFHAGERSTLGCRGYQGTIQFNNLRPDVREEKRLSVYKRQIRGSVT